MEKTVNRVDIKGYVGADPKITTFEDGRQVIKLNVATDDNYKDRSGEWRQETTWHTLIAWSGREMPDFNEIKKGQCVSAQGKIKNRNFEGRDGLARSVNEILAYSLKIHVPEETE